jgi:hypothetical protein
MVDSSRDEAYAAGGGPVRVPEARLHEIWAVIFGRHTLDAEKAVQAATQMRRAV